MTFFPSLLLIFISISTSYFEAPSITLDAAITVNLTVMLTTTTLLISVVKKLAQTSYIKWIEAWLIFAQLIPFTQVVLMTLIERFKKEELLKKKKLEKQEINIDKEGITDKNKVKIYFNHKVIKVTL